jgi:lipopolysaccharide/colanic/teichoic acid biosynthesis glycosyltransferase
MKPPQFIDIESSPAGLQRTVERAHSAAEQGELLAPERIRASETEAARREALERAGASQRGERPALSEGVLGAAPFQRVLERERCLADRGTRKFSLLVLRRLAGRHGRRRGRAALAELARLACLRLRTTDVVGLPAPDCVEILLTDTEPAGARVVAAWVQAAEARLGLDLEQTIRVYPSVSEGRAQEHDGATRPPAGGEGAAGWPLEDLWPHFGQPTPLWKRALDVFVSSLALAALAPLFGLIALAIRLDSRGPVIFRQQRAGLGARPFAFYKFRSMRADAEERRAELAAQNEQSGPIFKMRADPRITRVGHLLRRSSLDELPQLWNVLKGDISLVGPRSPTFDEVEKYERWQRRRLCVTGGITCTWQVSGRSEIPFRDWMRMDMRYVAARGPWLDLRLLAQTLPAVFSGRGAC